MSASQLQQYDLFLDENDWDIYYWATQEPSLTSMETAEGGGPDTATPEWQGKEMPGKELADQRVRDPAKGEWAQTVGTFKPAYRPVPNRWKNSEILSMLRRHVINRSAAGVHEVSGEDLKVDGKGLAQGVKGTGGGGLAFMPELKNFDQPA